MLPIFQPYTSGRVLNDALFINLGFFTGTSTEFQRQIAYAIAERQLETEIRTFLFPTVATFTETNFTTDNMLYAPVDRVIDVQQVIFYEQQPDGTDRLVSGTWQIMDGPLGLLRVFPSPYDTSVGSCGPVNEYSIGRGLYKADITVTAGLPSGVATNDPEVKLVLGIAADMVMKTMYDPGANAEPDMQAIQTFQSGRYLQTIMTKFHLTTAFGVGNKAQYLRSLLSKFKIQRAGKLGRR